MKLFAQPGKVQIDYTNLMLSCDIKSLSWITNTQRNMDLNSNPCYTNTRDSTKVWSFTCSVICSLQDVVFMCGWREKEDIIFRVKLSMSLFEWKLYRQQNKRSFSWWTMRHGIKWGSEKVAKYHEIERILDLTIPIVSTTVRNFSANKSHNNVFVCFTI